MADRNRKIIPYRRPLRVNIGLICFLILFIYLLFSATSYMKRPVIRYYEVEAGEMVNDTGHLGIVLRSENVYTAPTTGYINYYIRDGKRSAVGTRIFSLDETGNLRDYLEENSANSDTLSDQNLKDLKNSLTGFSASYSGKDFARVYDSRDAIQSELAEYTSLHILDNLDQSLGQQGISFTQVRSPETGVISFFIDGYEGLTPEQLSASNFDDSSYKANSLSAGEMAEAGTPVYKVISSENWQLVFPLTEKETAEYGDRSSLRVSFDNYDLTIPGDFRITTGADGSSLGVLTFHQFMVRFADQRLLRFRIETDREEGLKIPRSAITTKTFYTIPKSYQAKGGDSVEEGFYREIYTNGELTMEVVNPEIFYEADDMLYVDAAEDAVLKAGDVLIMPGSEERFTVGPTASLEGVYNINKGYAVFKQISIIEDNEEYVTVRKGTRYGLSVYDHILLDGSTGKEGAQVYQ